MTSPNYNPFLWSAEGKLIDWRGLECFDRAYISQEIEKLENLKQELEEKAQKAGSQRQKELTQGIRDKDKQLQYLKDRLAKLSSSESEEAIANHATDNNADAEPPPKLSVVASNGNVDQTRLVQLESTIERGLKAFYEVGMALAEIRDKKLYFELGYSTFEEYCQQRWGITRQYANREISAAAVVQNVSNCFQSDRLSENGNNCFQNGDVPENENNCSQNGSAPKNGNNCFQNDEASDENNLETSHELEETSTPVPQTLRFIPRNEAQAKPLTRLNPDLQRLACETIATTYPDGKVTAAEVEKVVKEVYQSQFQVRQVEDPPPFPKSQVGDHVQICLRNRADKELSIYNRQLAVVAELTEQGLVMVRVWGRVLPPLFQDELKPAPMRMEVTLTTELLAAWIEMGYRSPEEAITLMIEREGGKN